MKTKSRKRVIVRNKAAEVWKPVPFSKRWTPALPLLREPLWQEAQLFNYDPDQPRDESGRWTDTGKGGGSGDGGSSKPPKGEFDESFDPERDVEKAVAQVLKEVEEGKYEDPVVGAVVDVLDTPVSDILGSSPPEAQGPPPTGVIAALKENLAILKAMGGAIYEDAKEEFLEKAGKTYEALPPSLQTVVRWTGTLINGYRIFAGTPTRIGLAFVDRIGVREGWTKEETDKVKEMVARRDFWLTIPLTQGAKWGARIFTGGMIPGAGWAAEQAANWTIGYIPVGTMSYLAYRGIPGVGFLSWWKAVWDLTKDAGSGGLKGLNKLRDARKKRLETKRLAREQAAAGTVPYARPVLEEITDSVNRNSSISLNSTSQYEEFVEEIAETMEEHDFSDWYELLLTVCMDRVGPVSEAIDLAESLYETHPSPPPPVNVRKGSRGEKVLEKEILGRINSYKGPLMLPDSSSSIQPNTNTATSSVRVHLTPFRSTKMNFGGWTTLGWAFDPVYNEGEGTGGNCGIGAGGFQKGNTCARGGGGGGGSTGVTAAVGGGKGKKAKKVKTAALAPPGATGGAPAIPVGGGAEPESSPHEGGESATAAIGGFRVTITPEQERRVVKKMQETLDKLPTATSEGHWSDVPAAVIRRAGGTLAELVTAFGRRHGNVYSAALIATAGMATAAIAGVAGAGTGAALIGPAIIGGLASSEVYHVAKSIGALFATSKGSPERRHAVRSSYARALARGVLGAAEEEAAPVETPVARTTFAGPRKKRAGMEVVRRGFASNRAIYKGIVGNMSAEEVPDEFVEPLVQYIMSVAKDLGVSGIQVDKVKLKELFAAAMS